MTLRRAQFVVIAVVVTITTMVVMITAVSVRLAALGLPIDLSLESSLPFLGLAVGLLIASEWVRRVITTTREGADFRIRIAEGRLTMYRPGWHRTWAWTTGETSERVLGPDHPFHLSIRANLANAVLS